MADEIRAAIEVHLNLYELSRLRASAPRLDAAAVATEVRLKDNIGRVLLSAVAPNVRNAFEDDVRVEYPEHGFGRLYIPFHKLIDWIVGGTEAVRTPDVERGTR